MAMTTRRFAVAALGLGLSLAGVVPALAETGALSTPRPLSGLGGDELVDGGLLSGMLGTPGGLLGSLLNGPGGLLEGEGGLNGSDGGVVAGEDTLAEVTEGLTDAPGGGVFGGLAAVDGVLQGAPPVGGEATFENPAVGDGLLGGLLKLSAVSGILGGLL